MFVTYLEEVLGAGAQAQLLVDLLVELAAPRLQPPAARRHARVRALRGRARVRRGNR